ncbi:DEAD/DEAH box helicase [Luteibaculum oceani]|uniref:DEAD/DEAH box helicase n=1 Tax=Luteibaculum oceani TaxID=1294296 RepID=A0A5C6VAW2_9FLAO|nr:DEAD/DEAH box helicase [Luteibaculum oceani]TXC82020.1 DEAD/DEAH box helicase [Luteibaculum oceani]
MELSNFKDLKVVDEIVDALGYMGITKPTNIQQAAIPIILDNKDLIACSQTGTGKTASFLIPIIQNCIKKGENENYALVVCPTRELALQIDQQCDGISYFTGISSITLYGGTGGDKFDSNRKALQEGVNLIIGTPGKILSHLNLHPEIGKRIEVFVLDEADRMLDMGFVEDITRITKLLPNRKQNLLFSATMPPSIKDLARDILTDPEEISFQISKPAAKIKQRAISLTEGDKVNYLVDWVEKNQDLKSIIIFCGTKAAAKFVSFSLQSRNYSAKSLHSDKEQSAREEIMREFKSKNLKILIATDIASRGIDVEDIDVVINYNVPNDAADYVHRVGRTARAEKSGEAITFISPNDQKRFIKIEQLIERELEIENPEGYKSPIFNREEALKRKSYPKRNKKGGPRNKNHQYKRPAKK